MHIGFVATESPYGDRSSCGIAAYLRAMIPALLDAGHRVTLFANSKENRNFLAEDGQVPVYHLRLPSLHWYAAKVRGLSASRLCPCVNSSGPRLFIVRLRELPRIQNSTCSKRLKRELFF